MSGHEDTDAAVGNQFTVGDLIYKVISDGEVEVAVTTSTSISGDVTIPSTVSDGSETYDVTSIGDRAFYQCSGLTSVTIGNSVTSIGYRAFYQCSGLTSVTIGNSVTSIGDEAFNKCSGLTSVTIPDSVTSIGNYAFYGCSGLTSVTIPDSVTSIGKYAFSGCSSLTSVTFTSQNPPTIGSNAFRTNTTIEVTSPWDPVSAMEDASATTIVWANKPTYPDLIFTSDPSEGVVVFVGAEAFTSARMSAFGDLGRAVA